MSEIRLSKIMADRGLCSRREADAWIEKGWVFVNGQKINQLGVKFPPDVEIELAPQAQKEKQNLVTILLNKPVGWVSAQPEDNYRPAIELLSPENCYDPEGTCPIKDPRRLNNMAVAGRLDIDSQGLLVFTQDGTIARRIIQQDSEIEKEYLVRIPGSATPEQIAELRSGKLMLDGKKLKPVQIDWIHENQFRFVLKEGKKRQIRRMCNLVGLKVIGLKRVRVGNVRLGKLPEGQWRILAPDEKF